jgi:hypothetical protein
VAVLRECLVRGSDEKRRAARRHLILITVTGMSVIWSIVTSPCHAARPTPREEHAFPAVFCDRRLWKLCGAAVWDIKTACLDFLKCYRFEKY